MDKEKHHLNIAEILKWSNATTIRNHDDGGYTCCFCTQQYINPADLKNHNLHDHQNCDLNDASFIHESMHSYYVKLDITNLRCDICEEDIDTLENLIGHLKYEHERPLYTDINNRIIPFKFNTDVLTCFICSNTFYKFKGLQSHMNTHYRNFVCTVCDAGFITRMMVRMHTRTHETGQHKCNYCEKVFSSFPKRRAHERCVHTHKDTIYKCVYCSETFKYFNYKQSHMREVHGIDSTAKCQACDKTYSTQRKLMIHQKRDHLLERRHRCTYCDKKFFKAKELTEHVVKHTRTRDFECELCHKMFGLKKTLIQHMRTHLPKLKMRSKVY